MIYSEAVKALHSLWSALPAVLNLLVHLLWQLVLISIHGDTAVDNCYYIMYYYNLLYMAVVKRYCNS